MTAIEALAIILSVVSLVITIVGFFASLKFYRDGVQLQQRANDALTKIEEKTAFIQGQVGGMFDKTLDAALNKREIVAANFEEINTQLEQMKTKVTEEAIRQIGAAGEEERKRVAAVVSQEVGKVQAKVEETRESAQELAVPLNPIQAVLLQDLLYRGGTEEAHLLTARFMNSRVADHELSILEGEGLVRRRASGLVEMTQKARKIMGVSGYTPPVD